MIPPWYCKAYERLEREIKQSLETIVGDASRVKTVIPEQPHHICGGPAHPIFELYDAHNNLAASVSLGDIPIKPYYVSDKARTFSEEGRLSVQTYDPEFTPTNKLKPVYDTVGDVGKKVEEYAQEYLKLSDDLGEAIKGTILLKKIKDIDFLKQYAQKLKEFDRHLVIHFYDEAKWNQQGIAEAFGITEKDVNVLVAQIKSQLPQQYLDIEAKLDSF